MFQTYGGRPCFSYFRRIMEGLVFRVSDVEGLVFHVSDVSWKALFFIFQTYRGRHCFPCFRRIVEGFVFRVSDVSWKALVFTCRQSGYRPCGEHCQGACGCCCTSGQCCSCARSTCCDRSTCITVVSLVARPVIITVVWGIFSYLDPK